MSNIVGGYIIEAGTSDVIQSSRASGILLQPVQSVLPNDIRQNQRYFVDAGSELDKKIVIENMGSPKLIDNTVGEIGNNWSGICRTCANRADHVIPIFEGEGLEHELNSKIHSHLPIHISKEDTLPLHLCYHCAATLLAWHELAKGCSDAEQRLIQMQKNMHQKEVTTIIVQPLTAESAFHEADDHKVLGIESSHISMQESTNDHGESTSNDSERSSKMRMPFKAYLDTKDIFRRPYKKSHKKTNGKAVLQDSTELLWTTATDTGMDALPVASDPLQLSEIRVKQDHNGVNNDAAIKDTEALLGQRLAYKQEMELSEDAFIDDLGAGKTSVRDEDRMKCKFCSQEFVNEKLLTKHVKTHKILLDTQESYRCTECGKCFKLKDSYQRHMRIHNDERPFTCHICAKQFRDSGGLSRHLKDVHAKLKNFSCDICGNSFASKATREDHRRTHTGERPYICETCGNTFKSKASLYIHSKLHTDEFPHACSYCHKKFRRRQEMLAHVTTHTGEKNYACEVCAKRFRVKSELVRHKLIHSDDKPFVCNRCGLAFRQKRYLNNHLKNRHIETVRNC